MRKKERGVLTRTVTAVMSPRLGPTTGVVAPGPLVLTCLPREKWRMLWLLSILAVAVLFVVVRVVCRGGQRTGDADEGSEMEKGRMRG